MKRINGVGGTTPLSNAVDGIAYAHHAMRDGKWKLMRGDFKRLTGIKMLNDTTFTELATELLEIHNLHIVNMDSYFVVCEPAFFSGMREVPSEVIRSYTEEKAQVALYTPQLPDADVTLVVDTSADTKAVHNEIAKGFLALCKNNSSLEVVVHGRRKKVNINAVHEEGSKIILELVC